MSKYSDIKSDKLLEVVNTAIKEIDSHNLSDIYSSLNFFDSDVVKKATKNISLIINTSSLNGNLLNLKSELKSLKSVGNSINKYQELESEISALKARRRRRSRENLSTTSITKTINRKRKELDELRDKIDNFFALPIKK